SLRGFSGSEQWIAWLCPNGFGGSIFMDWVAPPPWNTQESVRFGKVFYVLFMDWQAIQVNYSTKFVEKAT
ncbi:hypothetical protein ACTQ07_10895, partial [Holdemanella porci]|uniref:hypothetical protein n=1 Tax=Holdemanella porci TaxID=2652276 RepID=UPI003F8F5A9C